MERIQTRGCRLVECNHRGDVVRTLHVFATRREAQKARFAAGAVAEARVGMHEPGIFQPGFPRRKWSERAITLRKERDARWLNGDYGVSVNR